MGFGVVVVVVVVVVGFTYEGFVGLVGDSVVVDTWVVEVLWCGDDVIVVDVVGLLVTGIIGVVCGLPVKKKSFYCNIFIFSM